MAKRPGNEPNLELPSFRLGRRKKATPAEAAPIRQPPAPPRHIPAPPSEPEVLVRRKPAPPAPPRPPAPPAAPAPTAAPTVQRRPPPPPAPPAPPALEPTPPSRHFSRASRHFSRPSGHLSRAKASRPAKSTKRTKAVRARRRILLPRIPGPIAALVTGGLIGGLTVSLAYGTAQGCDAVRGVGTCGGFGLFALVVILGIDVVLGAGLLRLCRVVDATTTALLGVGLLAVLAMLFFLRSTDSPAMVYVIPILMAVTFTAAQWVTNAIATKIGDN